VNVFTEAYSGKKRFSAALSIHSWHGQTPGQDSPPSDRFKHGASPIATA